MSHVAVRVKTENAGKVDRARELRTQGVPYQTIAAQLNVAHSTVFRWLNDGHLDDQREKTRIRERVRCEQQKELDAAMRRSLLEARRENRRLRRENRELREQMASMTPFSLTELHEWWLATRTPEQIQRIARGLAEWEEAAA